MLQAIFFDLDGTLLPMDNDAFTGLYFRHLAGKAAGWGYTDPRLLMKGIWDGVEAMVKNQGTETNFSAFWRVFSGLFGPQCEADIPRFDDFYTNEFHLARVATSPTPLAGEAVRTAREKAEYVILATNPIFPTCADVTRLSWIDLTLEDFDLVTDYYNSCHCKPNPAYFRDLLEQFRLDPAQCLMVGNDVQEDYEAATAAGIPVFLVTDHLINRKADFPADCPHGTYEEMLEYLKKL